MIRVAIVDYGSGNLHSAAKAFERAARDNEIRSKISVTSRPAEVENSDYIVLPGVGAFKDCRRGLLEVSGMWDALESAVHVKGRPFLGICVGMQLMATRGLEHAATEGLGWIAGDVKRVEPCGSAFKIPHMGWNTLKANRSHPLLDGLTLGPEGQHAYFVHSYHLDCQAKSDLLATTDHGTEITAMVARANVAGTQFHPEKSQALGLRLIANFLRWRP